MPGESCSHLLETDVLTVLSHLADKALPFVKFVPLNVNGTSAKQGCQILSRSCTKRLTSFRSVNSGKSNSMSIPVAIKNVDRIAINYRDDLTGQDSR